MEVECSHKKAAKSCSKEGAESTTIPLKNMEVVYFFFSGAPCLPPLSHPFQATRLALRTEEAFTNKRLPKQLFI
jgi:hypothetical protein